LVQTRTTSKRASWEEKLHLTHGQLAKEIYGTDIAKRATIGLISAHQLWQHLQEKFLLTEEELSQLKKDFFAGDQLNTAFCDYLKSIKDQYQIAILSNAWNNARNVYITKYHLITIAEHMLISAEEGVRKPDPQFYQLALEFLNLTPEETLFIDDTPDNILAASQLGINAILFTDTKTTIEKIEASINNK
jgi:putative hydrolase of the HAD superfamily